MLLMRKKLSVASLRLEHCTDLDEILYGDRLKDIIMILFIKENLIVPTVENFSLGATSKNRYKNKSMTA